MRDAGSAVNGARAAFFWPLGKHRIAFSVKIFLSLTKK